MFHNHSQRIFYLLLYWKIQILMKSNLLNMKTLFLYLFRIDALCMAIFIHAFEMISRLANHSKNDPQYCIHQLMCHIVSHHKSLFQNVFKSKILNSLWHLMHSTKILLIGNNDYFKNKLIIRATSDHLMPSNRFLEDS